MNKSEMPDCPCDYCGVAQPEVKLDTVHPIPKFSWKAYGWQFSDLAVRTSHPHRPRLCPDCVQSQADFYQAVNSIEESREYNSYLERTQDVRPEKLYRAGWWLGFVGISLTIIAFAIMNLCLALS